MTIACDIVLLVWNQREATRRCIDSVLAHTRRPARLLIVDNGSEPPTRAYLASVRSETLEVALLRNETNEGFARGMNRGLAASTAPWVCLLNNDTVVTQGWLERMLDVGEAHPEIGLINPASNTFGDRPASGVDLAAHAAAAAQREEAYIEVGACVGFCWLIRRAVITAIGGLDETLGLAFFEDTDYSRRAARAGFRSAVAPRAYVHHAEHQTVRTLARRRQRFDENRRRFEERWGRLLRLVYVTTAGESATPETLAPVLQRAVALARRGAIVQVVLPRRVDPSSHFRAAGVTRHADVHLLAAPGRRYATLWLLWRLCARRLTLRPAKLYDIVLAADARLAGALRRWRWWHRADVLHPLDEEALNRQWLLRCQSRSS